MPRGRDLRPRGAGNAASPEARERASRRSAGLVGVGVVVQGG